MRERAAGEKERARNEWKSEETAQEASVCSTTGLTRPPASSSMVALGPATDHFAPRPPSRDLSACIQFGGGRGGPKGTPSDLSACVQIGGPSAHGGGEHGSVAIQTHPWSPHAPRQVPAITVFHVSRFGHTVCVQVVMRASLRGLALLRTLPLLALSVLAPACSAPADAAASAEDDATRGGKIQLLVTVDWEGRDLRDDNLRAMENLHARFPDVKLVHFLNAAYFTKQGADADATKAQMARVIAPGDERGLHIHGWKRLFEASGVTFKSGPTFWGTTLGPEECTSDCGHEVPISLYSADELRRVVRFSVDKLDANGFGRAKSFRCGGWMAKDSVREAIRAEGIRYEQSAVPTAFLAPKLAPYPLHGWLGEIWQGTTETSQPFTMPTAAGDLVEVPDNGALADYVTADQMVAVFEANKAAWLRDKRRNVVVSIGFHQESASRFVFQVEGALARIKEIAERERIPLESITSERVRAR